MPFALWIFHECVMDERVESRKESESSGASLVSGGTCGLLHANPACFYYLKMQCRRRQVQMVIPTRKFMLTIWT